MVIEDGNRDGVCTGRGSEVKFVKIEIGENVTEGVSRTSIGFQTYKRRKQTKLNSGIEFKGVTVQETSHTLRDSNSDNLVKSPEDLWRSVLLQQICQSSSANGGNISTCVHNGIASHSRTNNPSRFKILDAKDGIINNGLARTETLFNTVQKASRRENGVVSNGPVENENKCSVNESCRRALLSIIDSQKFISMCKLLSENFRGIKADNIFDFSLVNSRIKEGAYENSPTLFLSDVQQIWRKFQAIGTEMVSLAESLSDFSKICYQEKVGVVSGHSVFEDVKHEFSTWESSSHAKVEHMDVCDASKVCACRSCGKKVEGIDCLVCDSCEEIYHISCIKPPIKEIPLNIWYCASCIAKGVSLRHDNCVVCERLNTPTALANGIGAILEKNQHNHFHGDENPNCTVDDAIEQLKVSKDFGSCKICGNVVESGDNFKICSHTFCPHKCFHTRCLTKKQLKSHDTCWYCPSCLCRACLVNQDDDKIVLCDGCDHGYHIFCMRPPLAAVPTGKWFCSRCEAEIRTIHRVKRARENFEKMQTKKGKNTFGNLGTKRINRRGE